MFPSFNDDKICKSILEFPNELIIDELFPYLSDTDLVLRISLVCKHFLQFANEEKIWKKRILRHLSVEMALQFFGTFKMWKIAYFNFKQMSQQGQVVSPTEIITFNESKRIGNFIKGKLNGPGKIILFNEKEWDVTFENNTITNHKIIALPDGKVAAGIFDNTLTGEGKITFQSGRIEEGCFHKGRLQGFGKRIHSNGTVIETFFVGGFLSTRTRSNKKLLGKNNASAK